MRLDKMIDLNAKDKIICIMLDKLNRIDNKINDFLLFNYSYNELKEIHDKIVDLDITVRKIIK